ncbi:CitE Citrate lyase beta subunit [Pyrenophora tritici-repentis]|uniref:CitE, Citrate lyase beta subunit n=2 Tax=Pyrenophora tritici-repentis TaxID=45151 RepID=A0A2W1HQB7_9PLEO|nr:citrate lyase subunit beta (Citrate (pro-3S)-lyase subunit beta) [Pyrenophora tritici-repentis Pt-1C-BFP]KAA8616685.1 Citrate lyase subunit beta [Pyrenophora tritici-repentis]EDU50890.1 citrate lyase subunit beta (Citrate (pro-3S)-lyase subunit beta) [Pyrenophora tritici-repentis Pt-1C-BFP]KAF7445980.1 Citrate lyase protein [Pyrenophora tritici-repentis]KAF7567077.1 CitE, Citrate lyase beta subunit [Pyrenophora tritici-repentis]KAG9381687.1 Citrate lyase protein [Pyrenophora tritici-repenti
MAAPIIRRACMYVPSSSKKMLEKSFAMHADNVTYDLEDSVAPHMKATARSNLRSILSTQRPSGIKEMCVRINSVDTGLALDDLTEVLKGKYLDAIMLPKCESAADLHFVTDVIRHLSPERHPSNTSGQKQGQREPVRIIALIESAKAIQNLSSICAASPYLSGLVFAAEDFAKDMSLTRTPSLMEFLYARSAIATAARAAELPSTIDLVCTSYKGDEGLKTLEEECLNGKGLGFNGKQCIHPSQVAVCHKAFSPGEKELEWAARVVIADEKASQAGRGAWTLDGKMIDAPVVKKAHAVLKHAQVCEMDVSAVRERWKGQEPE